jgi:hypothetical protein
MDQPRLWKFGGVLANIWSTKKQRHIAKLALFRTVKLWLISYHTKERKRKFDLNWMAISTLYKMIPILQYDIYARLHCIENNFKWIMDQPRLWKFGVVLANIWPTKNKDT